MPVAIRALATCVLLALPPYAHCVTETSIDPRSTKATPVAEESLDSPAQMAMKKLKKSDAPARPVRVAAAEITHPDLVTRLEEIRVYGRNEPEDYVGRKISPMMQLRARLERARPMTPWEKFRMPLCLVGLCADYGPEGIPLGDSPEARADARLNQSTTQLNAQFRGTLQ